MSRITPQAQRVINAARELGIPRSEWSVRTTTRAVRYEGRRFREYDDAMLYWRTASARRAIVEAAQRLADAGLCVTLVHGKSGSVVPIVSSGWNPRREVQHVYNEPKVTSQ